MKFYRNKEGKIVGELGEDLVYRSKRRSSKHILTIMDAWGIDKKILEELKEDNCIEVRIFDEDERAVYSVSLDTLTEKGVEKNFTGLQVFLPRKHWIKRVK